MNVIVTLCPFVGVRVFTVSMEPDPDKPIESDNVTPPAAEAGRIAHQASVPAALAFADVVPAVIIIVFPDIEYVRLVYVRMFEVGKPEVVFTGTDGKDTLDG